MDALSGIRVVDFSEAGFGPIATQMLGDLGAEVLKIERPVVGDLMRTPYTEEEEPIGVSVGFAGFNRNKKSVVLDLKKERGKEAALRLIATADVVLQNWRPGVADRMGIGYSRVKELNPRVIYCSLSGFGPAGPFAQRMGQDSLARAMGGLASIMGSEEDDFSMGAPSIADVIGAWLGAKGIITALFARERTGIGQEVELSLLDGVIALQIWELTLYMNTMKPIKRVGQGHGMIPPPQGIYKTQDGYVCVSAAYNTFPKFCKILGLDELIEDPRFQRGVGRQTHREELDRTFTEAFKQKTTAELERLFKENDVPSAPVNDYHDLLEDEQILTRDMFWEYVDPVGGYMKLVAYPVKFSESPARLRIGPPLLGEHTEAVLAEIGYRPEELDALRAEGVLGETIK